MTHIDEALPLAIVSAALYATLAIVSAYQYYKFRIIKEDVMFSSNNNSTRHGHLLWGGLSLRSSANRGRFDEQKVLFFLILSISACLDIPLYIACIANGGPDECEWDGIGYEIFWCAHLVATCGYMISIILPAVLWSDIINHKDGKIFRSKYPVDKTKRFFQVTTILYCSVMLFSITTVIIFFRPSDPSAFNEDSGHSSILNALGCVLEPSMIFVIIVGCFYSGIQLNRYVISVNLGDAVVGRFLQRHNAILLIILVSYIARAIFVLGLFYPMPHSYKTIPHRFFMWLVFTRWMPYIFCSFCLINEMKLSGSEISSLGLRSRNTSSIDQITPSPVSIQNDGDVRIVHQHTRVGVYGPEESSGDQSTGVGGFMSLFFNKVEEEDELHRSLLWGVEDSSRQVVDERGEVVNINNTSLSERDALNSEESEENKTGQFPSDSRNFI